MRDDRKKVVNPADSQAVASYLRQHRVEELVNQAVNDAVLANSAHPIAHIARFLARTAGLPELGDEGGAGQDHLGELVDPATAHSARHEAHASKELRLDELTLDEARIAEVLISTGQQHIFAEWPPDPEDSARKREFFRSALALDASYPGGLREYITTGKRLLAASRLGKNPLEGWAPSPPEGGTLLQPGTLEYEHFEEVGVSQLHLAAFVIPAGGMGERLGYSGVKLALPAELSTGCEVLRLYASYLLKFQRLAAAARGGAEVTIPLALMVSHETRPGIEALLRENGHFGLRAEQVVLLQQEAVACFSDAEGRLAMRERYAIETKPHGHGDVHFLLHTSGLAQRWLSQGRKWVVCFQDSGSLYLATLLASLGVSEAKGLDLNSVCVPRKAKEAIGAMARLTHADGRSALASVEYNQLEPLLRASGKGADCNSEESGLSPYPGNVNMLLFRTPTYVAALSYSQGRLLEFVNPKYKAGSEGQPSSAFKSPARLECLMQDFAHTLQQLTKGSSVGYTQVPSELGYFPVKNGLAAAADLSARGIPAMGAASAEFAVYHAHASLLRVLGCRVEQGEQVSYGGVRVLDGPRVVLLPSFAASVGELRRKLLSPALVQVSARSTLVLEGEGVTLGQLHLDGALVVRACQGATLHVESLEMHNKGWWFAPLSHAELSDAAVPEVERMRGYRLVRGEELRIELNEPGSWAVVKNELVRVRQGGEPAVPS